MGVYGGMGRALSSPLIQNECSLNGVDNHRWWANSNPTSWLKN